MRPTSPCEQPIDAKRFAVTPTHRNRDTATFRFAQTHGSLERFTVEMIRVLRVARRSAVKNRTMAANQLAALVTTAPDRLREQLRGLGTVELAAVAARFRPGDPIGPEPSRVD